MEVGLGADRELHDQRLGPEPIDDRLHVGVEVGSRAVELVDEADTWHAVPVGLAPDRLGLWLDACDAVEHCDGTVEHTERTLDFDGEVDVARGVDDVDGVAVPLAGGRSGGDGDAALLIRSVNVVLPASMWAMIPMLRTLSRGALLLLIGLFLDQVVNPTIPRPRWKWDCRASERWVDYQR